MQPHQEFFSQLLGNDKLKSKLASALCADPPAVSHAYILEGPYGSGKHTLAKEIAAALVCTNRNEKQIPCGECLHCRKIRKNISPDVIIVCRESEKSSMGVDTVRDLRNDVHIYPNELDYKFYIVEDADTMTVQAQNALLLTLEEPPAYTVIFLLCENSRALLETVRSRSQVLRLQPLGNEDTTACILNNIPDAAALLQRDPQRFSAAVAASRGCPGRAADLLFSDEGAEISARRAEIEKFLPLAADRTTAAEAMCLLVNDCRGSRDTASRMLSDLSDALRDLILLKNSEKAELRFFTDAAKAAELSAAFPVRRLLALSDAAAQAAAEIDKNRNVRLCLMTMLQSAEIL